MQNENQLVTILKGFMIMALISCILIVIWNILNFILFQWFGFRYYGFTFRSILYGFILFLIAFAPLIVGAANHMLPLGIAISIFSIPAVLIGLRMEATAYRNDPNW